MVHGQIRVYRNKKLRVKHDENMIAFLLDFDRYYDRVYHKYI